MLEISFPDQDAARGGLLAQELRGALIREGVPPDGLVIAKSDGESMDLGAVLQVVQAASGPLQQALEPIVSMVHIGTFALVVYEFCRRHRSGLRLKGPDGMPVQLSEQEVEVERLEALIAEMKLGGRFASS